MYTKVLLCHPSYFEVKYQINPWMKVGSVNKSLALKQWNKLKEVYEDLGIKVSVIDQDKDFPDMVFATDQGIINGNKILLANFKYRERKGETNIYKNYFLKNNYEIHELPSLINLEGGDVVSFEDAIFLGNGFRTSISSSKYLKKFLHKKIYSLNLVDPYFYHLDTCLFVLDRGHAFYFSKAFDEKSKKILKQLIPNLIPLTKKEAFSFTANCVVLGKNILVQKGNKKFNNNLKELGYKIIEIDVSEFIKAGGGIHCLTLFI